ncbi:hypothetical protein [Kibdelosporangium aridum]|uniref:hypothetical protein n=1 Tax=Kibdelosporangium aridum TaxID=2030 RepID=UPI0005269846
MIAIAAVGHVIVNSQLADTSVSVTGGRLGGPNQMVLADSCRAPISASMASDGGALEAVWRH